jgi:Arc/MetJ family transcription regulator
VETNLALDEKLLEEALQLGGHSTRRDTVNEALLEYIQRRKRLAAPGTESSQSVSEANHRLLALLQAWQDEPLTSDEERLLDEFEAFQAKHPLRFATPQEES